jgi:hypothetical protein
MCGEDSNYHVVVNPLLYARIWFISRFCAVCGQILSTRFQARFARFTAIQTRCRSFRCSVSGCAPLQWSSYLDGSIPCFVGGSVVRLKRLYMPLMCGFGQVFN